MQLAHTDGSMDFIKSLCGEFEKHNRIDPAYYEKWDVKRGLRNADGTGVLAGITQIGNVLGYYVQDGERFPMEGRLIYRGIDLGDLVDGFMSENRFGFEETAYLLLFGALPTREQLKLFQRALSIHQPLPPMFTEDMILRAPSADVMNKLARSVLSLYSYDDAPEDRSLESELGKAIALIARLPTIAAHAYAAKRHYYDDESLYLHRPQEGLGVAENFLYSVRHDNQFTQEEARLLDLCLVLHAEHGGGNNSAFACRVLSSSGTDIYSSIAAAIGSLKGPRHGGANKKVMEMFGYIEDGVKDWRDEDEIRSYLGRGPRHLHPVRPPGRAAEEVRQVPGRQEGHAGRVRALRGGGAPHPRGAVRLRPAEGGVRQRGPVLRPGVQDDGHPPGAVHPPVRRGPGGGLVRPPHRGGLQPRQ